MLGTVGSESVYCFDIQRVRSWQAATGPHREGPKWYPSLIAIEVQSKHNPTVLPLGHCLSLCDGVCSEVVA